MSAYTYTTKAFFPQAKLDSKINVLLSEVGDLYFLSHDSSVHITLFNFLKKKKLSDDKKKDIGESLQKTVLWNAN